MKIKHNFILMSLVLSLLMLIVFLNTFNLLTISKSYYNNFELAVSSTINQREYIKVYIQIEDNNKKIFKTKDILAQVINLADDNFNFILVGADKKIDLNNEKQLKTVFNEPQNLFREELDLVNAKNNIENLSDNGKIIIITDGELLNKSLSFSDFNNLNQSGMQVHIIQLFDISERKAVRLKSLAGLGGGEYLEKASAREIYRLLKNEN